MNQVQKIAAIDTQIDIVKTSILRLEKINLYSAASWQRAWDKHPDMEARMVELYRQRGVAQHERNEAEYAARIRLARSERRAAKVA